MTTHRDRTIEDFGRQWTVFNKTEGYGASVDLLADYIAPVEVGERRGRKVADIGAGNGRFVFALLEAGAAEVIAVEPS